LIELRPALGAPRTRAYEQVTSRQFTVGDVLEYEGAYWVFRDREDRDGVTVYVFNAATSEDFVAAEELRRSRVGSVRRRAR